MFVLHIYVMFLVGCAFDYAHGERERFDWGTVTQNEFCDYETFTAECRQGEMIVMESAIYGHIKLGKCIETDLGVLGCFEDVMNVLDSKCTGKQQCSIPVQDQTLRDTTPCSKGMSLYLEASYWCVPEHNNICSPITANPSESFISSTQIYASSCQRSTSISLETVPGQHIVLSLVVPGSGATEGTVFGLAVGDLPDDEVELEYRGTQTGALGELISSHVTLVLDPRFVREPFLIGFRAEGCPNLSPPPTTEFRRKGDTATVSCKETSQSWQLTCRGVHWLGVIGNCSKRAPLVMESKVLIEEPTLTLALPKDAVFLIIGCATLFVSLVVITVGYVTLKRARLQQIPTPAPLNYTTVQRRSILKQRPNSDYLTPTYPADGQEAQVYDFPLPDIPVTETLQTRGTVKRNNEEDYTASLSSTSTDYTRKYFVLDKDYIAVNNMHNC